MLIQYGYHWFYLVYCGVFFCLIDLFLITEKYKKNITVAIKDVLNFNIYIIRIKNVIAFRLFFFL